MRRRCYWSCWRENGRVGSSSETTAGKIAGAGDAADATWRSGGLDRRLPSHPGPRRIRDTGIDRHVDQRRDQHHGRQTRATASSCGARRSAWRRWHWRRCWPRTCRRRSSRRSRARSTSELPHFAPRAKRVIFLYMIGGPSQLDLFEPKAAVDRGATASRFPNRSSRGSSSRRFRRSSRG